MKLNETRILVTGADGFIGSHLVEALVRHHQCHVTALVLYNAFGQCGWLDSIASDVKSEIDVVAGDIRDETLLLRAMRGCDVVFHLAALVGIPYSYQSPVSYVDTNVTGTLRVLEAARAAEVRKVVHTSTSEVYGTAEYVPMTEDHRLHAQSPYAATKIAADQLALSFHATFDTPVAIIRPFNTYGPRQSLRAVIPSVITQLASGRRRLQLGALHPTRDFNFVDDTVRGFTAIAASDQTVGEVTNIGSGYETSIADVVQLIADVMECSVQVETDATRLRPPGSEVDRLCADNTKAFALTGWSPGFAGPVGLRRGLERTVRWFCDPENLASYQGKDYHV
ncbi:NAD-dependent 4,6-dehydratase LegB [Alicyclobacillus sp. ALC3]|uniref:NAD-dependent 4,6-dehydratase LegB n=1 Tax=Alicyclobacillus sp. ALC3 TaxID=2796143 RepID=UPI002378598C|nr:NAD-dependent 4,6-dehydratase LegB [Alicyclobacillus sp. ALC3]WDL95135.1 GDP-mannose 4,6-dehydratase [Alicyclobacillus sp. ALC3]